MNASSGDSKLLFCGGNGTAQASDSAVVLEQAIDEMQKLERPLPRHIDANPEAVERGLARLVLTLIELLRQVLEHQAIRRIEGGSLTNEEIERLGLTFLRLAQRMKELQGVFDLSDEDLNLNLGPLGDLM